MSLASDEDIRTAAPLIEPLLQLAGSPSLKWATTSNRDGFTVCEIPSAPALHIPLKCFRTQFVVTADVETLARVVVNEDAVRRCDPTLKELRVLSGDRRNSLLYTAYMSPSPWLISPRDFCVEVATVLTTPAQLSRVCPRTPATVFPEYLREQTTATSPFPRTAFLQNSMSTTSPLCPPPAAKVGDATYVRGFVHCYGYLAWADARVRNKLHVINFCCVDACGRIPKWLVAAAVDANTQKLKRIAQLAESTAKKQIDPVVIPTAADDAHTPRPSPPQQQQRHASTPQLVSPTPQHIEVSGDAERTQSSGSLNPTLENLSSTLPMEPPTHVGSLYEEALYGTQTPGTMMSALTDTLSATTSRSCPPLSAPATPPATSPPSGPPLNTTTSSTSPTQVCQDGFERQQLREQEPEQAQEHDQKPLSPRLTLPDSMVLPLAQLARAHGWHVLREKNNVEYAELRDLPSSLKSKDDLCVALRVSTTVRCTLDVVEEVLRSPMHAPEVDPELMRLVGLSSSVSLSPSSSPHRKSNTADDQRQRQPSSGRGEDREANGSPEQNTASCFASSTASRHSCSAVTSPCQLRHFQFNTQPPFTHSWDMLLCCTEGELSPYEGGQLGFHTPGLHASTYVWVGNSGNSHDGSTPFDARGFQRMYLRVFGVVAVAIPRSAAAVRVTHYVLFDAAALSSSSVYLTDSKFAVRGQKRVTAVFLSAVHSWMGDRMCRLGRLCETLQLQHVSHAMAPLDKEPLLRYLHQVHCSQQAAAETFTPHHIGDVLVWRTGFAHENGSGAVPPLYVFTLTFPCSLRHLREYMEATSARSRYTLDERVVLYEEVASSPGFRTIHLEMCSSEDDSRPRASFSFLEAFGLLHGNGVLHPTMVLGRANCDELQRHAVGREVGEEPDEGNVSWCNSWSSSWSFADDSMRVARIYCSGWVAVALRGDGEDDADEDDDQSSSSSSRSRDTLSSPFTQPTAYSSNVVHKRELMRRLVSAAKRRLGDSLAKSEVAKDAQSKKTAAAAAERRILVTQYSCVRVGGSSDGRELTTDDEELCSPLVRREAMLLQRFRDAVCSWKSV